MLDKLKLYFILMRFNRPVGLFLLLWPALWALWLAAQGTPDLSILIIFLIGVVLMRAAGCVINDIADRKIDRFVERTKQRPITSGKVSKREALILFFVLVALAFILVLQLNMLTVYLSFAALALASLYPFMKRHTHLPQVVLGMAFASSVPMAFAAQTGDIPKQAWLLYVLTVIWTVIYDTMYAMVDREDDLKIGVKSTAILFGDADKIILAVFQILLVIGYLLLGNELGLDIYYYSALVIASCFFIYQQYLIKDRDKALCFKAFLNNNWFGLSIYLGIVAHYALPI
ncbi:4-hydroxybenzoate polyprenyltransferase [hydrothermal vent metagenome]|uniref:4-hydroxybenzoate polyprenyltransferase n=1 Tax=hydrothermal vent metagenome TaxID=652676 RepID=A0A3B1AQK8_9ZZZZ